MLNYLQKRYAKARMAAYIDGELKPSSRRFVARLIDQHPDLRAAYQQRREIRQQLERDLPVIGQVDSQQISAMWANIQAQMADDTLQVPPRTQHMPHFSLSYGVVMALVAMAMLLPLAFDASTANAAVPAELPAPALPATTEVPAQDQTAQTVVALKSETEELSTAVRPLVDEYNTPHVATTAQP